MLSILLFLILACECRKFGENKPELSHVNTSCYLKGGHCVKNQYCYNGIISKGLCDNLSEDQNCCLPKPREKCQIERCDGLIQDCTQDKEFLRFTPLLCRVYKRCGITNNTYHSICRANPSLNLVCCAAESKILKSSNGFRTLEVGPDGSIEGVLFDDHYIEHEMWKARLSNVPLISEVVCITIAVLALLLLMYIKIREYLQTRPASFTTTS